jgi:peptidoglycan DL-endopeptidase CwlO
VQRLPHGRQSKAQSRRARARFSRHPARSRSGRRHSAGIGRQRAWGRAAVLAAAAILVSLALPSGVGSATAATPQSLKATLTEANNLSNQIDNLGQEYDALKIQLTEARAESKIAAETAQRDEQLLAAGQAAVGQIAAEGYMTGGVNPAIQLLQSSDPQQFLNRASIILQLAQENGEKVSLYAEARAAATRARLTALQQTAQANKLTAAMSTKVAEIQAKENILNGSAFSQAMAIFDQTGSYPDISVSGDSLGVQALRFALTRIGDPYVWGGAGPDDFDCSGLVMWAYAQVGISLEHFTGDQWDEGVHISRSQLEPGDLVFFYPDISHVGLYVGDGMMVDAPTFGQDVQIQPVMWNVYVGAVRII